jgi:uncharacterized membrane protein
MTHKEVNVSTTERILTVIAGSYVLYNAFRNEESIFKKIAAAYTIYRGASGHCPVYAMMHDNMNVNIRTSLIINRPVSEIYHFWRNLSNLPLFMEHLESVEMNPDGSSHWTANIPGGLGTISWNAVIVNDHENDVIGWTSTEGSEIDNAGKVEFVYIDENKTGMHIVFSYRAPLGKVGEEIARLFTPAFEKLIRSDIKSFKQFMEVGFTDKDRSDFRNGLI